MPRTRAQRELSDLASPDLIQTYLSYRGWEKTHDKSSSYITWIQYKAIACKRYELIQSLDPKNRGHTGKTTALFNTLSLFEEVPASDLLKQFSRDSRYGAPAW